MAAGIFRHGFRLTTLARHDREDLRRTPAEYEAAAGRSSALGHRWQQMVLIEPRRSGRSAIGGVSGIRRAEGMSDGSAVSSTNSAASGAGRPRPAAAENGSKGTGGSTRLQSRCWSPSVKATRRNDAPAAAAGRNRPLIPVFGPRGHLAGGHAHNPQTRLGSSARAARGDCEGLTWRESAAGSGSGAASSGACRALRAPFSAARVRANSASCPRESAPRPRLSRVRWRTMNGSVRSLRTPGPSRRWDRRRSGPARVRHWIAGC